MNSTELRQKRAGLIHLAREVHNSAEAKDRDLTAEENEQFDRLMDEAESLRMRIERDERSAAMEADLRASMADPQLKQETDDGGERASDEKESLQARAWNSYLKGGVRELPTPEARALQADQDIYGGYLTAPQMFVNQLIKDVDNLVWMRQWATKYTVTSSESMGVPSLENDPADPTWTAEIATGTEDSTMSFGTRELHPHPLAKYIKVSRKLLRMVPSAEGLVRSRMAYKFAVTEEEAFLNGSGSNSPLGVFTASASGINTGRDASTGNTTTAVTFDGLIEAKYTLKGQYWPAAKWLAHRDFYKMVSKLKDGDGQYLWRESVRAGEPDRLLGLPAFTSEYAPNTFTQGLYVGILGDFSHYWIADALSMDMQRLEELYAITNQIGFIGRLECDGMPVLEEAFVRVTLDS
jgi:HK97 family phage major capsid protein